MEGNIVKVDRVVRRLRQWDYEFMQAWTTQRDSVKGREKGMVVSFVSLRLGHLILFTHSWKRKTTAVFTYCYQDSLIL